MHLYGSRSLIRGKTWMGSSNARPLSGGRSAALSCPAALSAVCSRCNRCRRGCHWRHGCAAGLLNGPSCLEASTLLYHVKIRGKGGWGAHNFTLWIDTTACNMLQLDDCATGVGGAVSVRVRQIKNMACLSNCWGGGWARRQSARAGGCCRPDVEHCVLCLRCVCMLCLGLRPATCGVDRRADWTPAG